MPASVLRSLSRRPWLVAVVVGLVYGCWLLFVALSGHDARDFTVMSVRLIDRSHASSVIKVDPDYRAEFLKSYGYDGQYSYYIALDPANARYYLDDPAYRYTRILYPMVVRVLALGNPNIIPAMLILVNFGAIIAGTLIIATWLGLYGTSPWFATAYGLFPGLFVSLRRDLTEPLAFAMIALGIYVLYVGGRRRFWYAGICLGLAALAREQTAIFAAVIGAAVFLGAQPGAGFSRGRTTSRQDGVIILALGLLPLLAWKLFLHAWLGKTGVPSNNLPALLPFGGLISDWPWGIQKWHAVLSVAVPGVICLALSIWSIPKIWRDPLPWVLMANVVLFVVFLNADTFSNFLGAGRVTDGVLVSVLLCLPFLRRLSSWSLPWVGVCIMFWLAAWSAIPRRDLFF